MEMTEATVKSCDPASIEMIEKATTDEVDTVFNRAEAINPCPIGAVGSCCKHCGMGPCRVIMPKSKTETPQVHRRHPSFIKEAERPGWLGLGCL